MALKNPIRSKRWGTSFIERGEYSRNVSSLFFTAPVAIDDYLILEVGTRMENELMNKWRSFIMKRCFKIEFEFPLYESELQLPLAAIAELHHSDPYYRVFGFALTQAAGTGPSLLPPQEIRAETRAGKRTWVHLDSGKATLLSTILGEAIDRSG
jgi:hypothetical protein